MKLHLVAIVALGVLVSCGYNLGDPRPISECVAVCPQPVCPQPVCPTPPTPELPYCPADYPVERTAGGCDLDTACEWLNCDDPPRMCWTNADCCGETPVKDCPVRCMPLWCGGICALPLPD